jgi:hypothetical protein
MLGVVIPFTHKYDEPELEVKVTLPPLQNTVDPLVVIVGAEGG